MNQLEIEIKHGVTLEQANLLIREIAHSRDEGVSIVGGYGILLERFKNLEIEFTRLQMEIDASCNAEELRQVRAINAQLLTDNERLGRALIKLSDELIDQGIQVPEYVRDALNPVLFAERPR